MIRDGLVSSKVIGDLLNLTPRRVEQLAQKRIIPKASRGKYDPVPVVQAYIRYLQQQLAGGGEVIDEKEMKDRLLRAKAEEREAKAEQARITVNIQKGQLMPREEVIRDWAGRLVEVKGAMLELPRRIGFLFSDPHVRDTVEEEVEKTVYEILETYSRDGPHTLGSGGAGGTETTGTSRRERVGGRKQNIDQGVQ